MIIVTTRQMQQMDKNTIETFGIPGRVLMENAGRGALEVLSDYFDLEGTGVAVVAGRGQQRRRRICDRTLPYGDGCKRQLLSFIYPGPGPGRCQSQYGSGTGLMAEHPCHSSLKFRTKTP